MTQLLRYLTIERLEALVTNAMLNGVRVVREGSRRFILPYDGSCSDPIGVELHSRFNSREKGSKPPIIVDMMVPCRKCENCRLRRSLMWRDRAIAEFRAAPLTVFGTLTFRPELHWQADAAVIGRLGNADWSALTAAEQFAYRSKELGSHVTNWLKVIRWGRSKKRLLKDRPNLRYLVVCEAHNSVRTSDEMRGRPHFHCLIHDLTNDGRLFAGSPVQAMLTGCTDGDWTMRKIKARNGWRPGAFLIDTAPVRTAWPHGHTKFQWCENEQTATYLTKYLSKELDARVRASQFYGETHRHVEQQRNLDRLPLPEKGEREGLDPSGLKKEPI